MISETTLATGFSSFWGKTLPYSEKAIRKINIGMSTYLFSRKNIDIEASRRAFLNEIAYSLFCLDITLGHDFVRNTIISKNLEIAVAQATAHQNKFSHVNESNLGPLNDNEYQDLDNLIDGFNALLQTYIRRNRLIVRPEFLGCGMLNQSRGDLIINDTLYEIKAAERKFRSIDVRQLLIYCALNASTSLQPISKAGCYNPRTGQHFCLTLEELSLEFSGKGSSELFSEIIYYLSSGDVSR